MTVYVDVQQNPDTLQWTYNGQQIEERRIVTEELRTGHLRTDPEFQVVFQNMNREQQKEQEEHNKQVVQAGGVPKPHSPTKYAGASAVNKVAELEGYLDPIQKYVVEHEGYVDGVYEDTKGIKTSGVGQTGKYMDMSFKDSYNEFVDLTKNYIPSYDKLSENQQKALLSLAYRGDLKLSPTFRDHVNAGEFEKASVELLNHDEYKQLKQKEKETGKKSGITKRLEEASKFIKG